MSFRVVAFPYTPPADAPYANLCLPAQPGDRLRVLRRVDAWSIVEWNGRLGLFPIILTRDEHPERLVVRKARQEFVEAASLPLEDNIFLNDTTTTATINNEEDNVNIAHHVDSPCEKDGDNHNAVFITGSRNGSSICTENSSSGSSSPATIHDCSVDFNADSEKAKKIKRNDPLFTKVCFSPVKDADGCNDGDICTNINNSNNEGPKTLRGECISDASSCPVEEGEVITRAHRCMTSPAEKPDKSSLSQLQHTGEIMNRNNISSDDEEGGKHKLRRQYVQLGAEIAWLSSVTERVRAEYKRMVNARASDAEERVAEERANAEKVNQLSRDVANKKAELRKAKKYIGRLRSILQSHGLTDLLLESSSPTAVQYVGDKKNVTKVEQNSDEEVEEEEEEEDGEVPEPVELRQDSKAAAEVHEIKECIKREQETLQYYGEQYAQLVARKKHLCNIEAAIEEESCLLQESEEALDAVAPEGTYIVVCSGGGGSTQQQQSSDDVAANKQVGNVEVSMQEGFVWPATLRGLTAEEQDAVDNYQRLFNKYETRRHKWREEHGEATTSSSAENERLRRTLATGDMALGKLLQQTEKMKEFVTKYRPLAESIQEQVAVSRRALERQQERCHNIRAEYEAAIMTKR